MAAGLGGQHKIKIFREAGVIGGGMFLFSLFLYFQFGVFVPVKLFVPLRQVDINLYDELPKEIKYFSVIHAILSQ